MNVIQLFTRPPRPEPRLPSQVFLWTFFQDRSIRFTIRKIDGPLALLIRLDGEEEDKLLACHSGAARIFAHRLRSWMNKNGLTEDQQLEGVTAVGTAYSFKLAAAFEWEFLLPDKESPHGDV